ncbi:MAG: DUF2079 domain-containing protein [Anaerolineae bacterium]|nr:DUF2079 domain-containing protein [Anaerolineae bacterium]
MSQSIWSATRGRPLLFTFREGPLSRLALHVEAIYFLIAPLYALFPSPETLLIFQAFLFAGGAVPLYVLAFRRLESANMAFLVMAIYLLYPAALSAVLFDFHGDTLAMPLLCFAFEALERRAWRSSALWLFLSLLCKFYVAAAVVVLGLILYVKGERRAGALIGLAGGVWGLVAFFVIRPLFAGSFAFPAQATTSSYLSFYFGRVNEFPFLELEGRLLAFIVVFVPALWLAWRATTWMLPAFVVAFPALIAVGEVSAYHYRFHHYAIAVPFLMLAIIEGASKLRQDQIRFAGQSHRGRPWRGELGMTLAITAVFTVSLVDIPLNPFFWISPPGWGFDELAYGRSSRDILKDEWLAEHVSSDSSVMTSMMLAPHLSNRERLYMFGDSSRLLPDDVTQRLGDTDIAIVDALYDYIAPGREAKWQGGGHPNPDAGGVMHDIPAVAVLLARTDFGLVEVRDGLLLFEKNAPSQARLSQQVVVTMTASQPVLRARFGDAVGMVDADVALENRRLCLDYSWVPLKSMADQAPLFAVSRLEGVEDARIVHLPTQVLYPTSSWELGQLVFEMFEAPLPSQIPPGTYRVLVGWYNSANLFSGRTDVRSRIGDEIMVTTVVVP